MSNLHWWTRDELLGADLRWLVRLDWAGLVLHLSTHETEAVDPVSGDTVRWAPAVDPFAWGEQLDLFALSPSTRSLDLTLRIPWVDVPARIMGGKDLHQCQVRLYRHIVGTSRTMPYLQGRVRDYTYEAKGSPVDISIEENPWDDSGSLLPEQARVSADTWPSASDKIDGERYPVILGAPGMVSGSAIPATPAYPVDSSERYLLIAGHRVSASSVTIFDEDTGSNDTATVETVSDGLGRLVSVVDINATSLSYDGDHKYRVGWSGGAGKMHEGGTPIRSAGDALRWAARQSTAAWDIVGVEVSSRLLDGYVIDGAIVGSPDETLTPWDWLTAQLLPLLPVSIHGGPRGLAVHVWPLTLSPVASLERGADEVSRVSRVESEDRTRLLSTSSLRYAYNGQEDAYSSRVAAVSQSEDAVDGGTVERHLQAGRIRYGAGRAEDETTDIVYHAGTAGAVVAWRAQLFGLPSFSVAYQLPQRYGWLRLGDRVEVTDDEVGFSAAAAVVESIEYLPSGRLEVGLRVSDPLAD